jgi:hypothetical protein
MIAKEFLEVAAMIESKNNHFSFFGNETNYVLPIRLFKAMNESFLLNLFEYAF